jgi:hypothetical protein
MGDERMRDIGKGRSASGERRAANAVLAAALIALVACSSSSDAGSDGGGGGGCPKPPNRSVGPQPEGAVFCNSPSSSNDETLIICHDGQWQTVLDCADSTRTTAGGFVHSCKCYDGATGDSASCGYLANNDCGVTVNRGGSDAGSGSSGSSSGSSGSSGSSSGSSGGGGVAIDGG